MKNRILKIFIFGICIANGFDFAFASELKEKAARAGRDTHIAARAAAERAFAQDFERAVNEIKEMNGSIGNIGSELDSIARDMIQIEQQMLIFANLSIDEMKNTFQTTQAVMDRYSTFLSQYIAATFRKVEKEEKLINFRPQLDSVIHKLQNVCRAGRADHSASFSLGAVPQLNYDYSFMLNYSQGSEGSSTSATLGGGAASHKDRQRYGSYADLATTVGVIYSPNEYSIAAKVLVNTIIGVANALDTYEVQDDVTAAMWEKFNGIATSADFNKYYREYCPQNILLIEQLLSDIDALVRGSPDERARLDRKLDGLKSDAAEIAVKLEDIRKLHCRTYSPKGENLPPDAIGVCDPYFESTYDKLQKERDIERLVKLLGEITLENKSNFIYYQTMQNYRAIASLRNRPEFNKINLKFMDTQRQAMTKMSNTVRLLVLIKELGLDKNEFGQSALEIIESDLDAFRELEKLRGRYISLVGNKIRLIFGRYNQAQYNREQAEFERNLNAIEKASTNLQSYNELEVGFRRLKGLQ